MSKQILIVGCGSIGERHLRCFRQTGRAAVAACDTNPDSLARIREKYPVETLAGLEESLASRPWDGVVVCTPAHTHVGIALSAVRNGAAVLIEKPLSTNLDGVDGLLREIASAGKFAGVAYVYHFMPAVQKAREFLRAGSLGKLLQVSVVTGQHFPTFRPAYREIYYNRHETGGGAIQDALTHLVNAVEWMVGPTDKVFCEAAHQMLEGVSVEDTVSVTTKNSGVLATYSLNQFQAPNELTMQIHGEGGSVKIEIHEQRWAHFARGAEKWVYHPEPVNHRDDLFIAQANAFLDGIEGKATPLCTIDEALQTLKFNLAALESARTGRAIATGSRLFSGRE